MKLLTFVMTGLLIVLGIAYLGVKYAKEQSIQELEKLKHVADSSATAKPLSETDSLRMMLESYRSEIEGKESKMDSLKKALMEKEQQVTKVSQNLKQTANQKETELQRAEKAKTMAKTFEKMEVKEIAPILRNLDDRTVMLIYKETSNRFKKNILLAVNEKRAALITKNFITKN